jgi:hypothetical protein
MKAWYRAYHCAQRKCRFLVDKENLLLAHPPNRALEQMDQAGLNANRKQWKQHSPYHRCSKAENAFFPWKTIHGPCQLCPKIINQHTQAAIKVALLKSFYTNINANSRQSGLTIIENRPRWPSLQVIQQSPFLDVCLLALPITYL